jgi:prepilin-type N-terminal cleavage/methylation domain-containing protein
MNHKGFTLIEMLVVVALLAIIMIGLLNLLDTSSKISVVETELADTQENVRFTAYHLLRTARMMGSSAIPMAANVGGTDRWLAAELRSNVASTFTEYATTFDVAPGSDVLTLYGMFEIPAFFTDPRSDFSSSNVTIRESNAVPEEINPGMDLIDIDADNLPEGLQGRGLLFLGKMDQNEYAVAEIANNGTLTGTAAANDRVLTLPFIVGADHWKNLNSNHDMTSGMPFDTYRVCILERYVYFVDPEFNLMRIRAGGVSGVMVTEPVAVNIGNLQIELGVDTTDDGLADTWRSAPTATTIAGDRVLAMRITVFGRTGRQVADWTEPAATFQTASGALVADLDLDDLDRFAKWRRIQVEAALRNYLF